MDLLIKNGRIIDPSAGRDETADIFVKDGKIAPVPGEITKETKVIEAEGLWVIPGLIDLHVHLRDPGLTHKETIETGSMAAAAGGVTTICAMPNTKPITDSAETVTYVKEKGDKAGLTHVLPIGAITMGQKGEVLTDQKALMEAGICAISEDGRSVADEKLMKEAMINAKENDLLIMDHCEDEAAAKSGDSRTAENLMTFRELKLAEEVGCKLHICHVSTRESYEYVKESRKNVAEGKCAEGTRITAEVCPHHFFLDDSMLEGGDPNFKMNPPLRAKEDVQAMKDALREGVITCISTDHAPHTAEDKKRPMETAANGIIGMEQALSVSMTALLGEVLPPMQLVACMSTNPAKVLGIDKGTLKEGACADICLVDPKEKYIVKEEDIFSKAKNCPYLGMELTGRVKMTVVDGVIVYENGKILK